MNYQLVFQYHREGEQWLNARYPVHMALMKASAAKPYLPEQAQVADDFIDRMTYLLDDNQEIPNYQQELFKYCFEGWFLPGLVVKEPPCLDLILL